MRPSAFIVSCETSAVVAHSETFGLSCVVVSMVGASAHNETIGFFVSCETLAVVAHSETFGFWRFSETWGGF